MLTRDADAERVGLLTSNTKKITRRVGRMPEPRPAGASIATLIDSSMISVTGAIMDPPDAGATVALPRPGATAGAGLSSRVG